MTPKTTPRKRYAQALKTLAESLRMADRLCLQMGGMVNETLMDKETLSIETMKNLESHVQEICAAIDRQCLSLILHEQPVARDLQLITIASKISTDLSRIAHLYLDLSKIVLRLGTVHRFDLQVMNRLCLDLLENSFASVKERSIVKAALADRLDDEIDGRFRTLKDTLINEHLERRLGVDLLMAAKYIERIADHGVLIADSLKNSLDAS